MSPEPEPPARLTGREPGTPEWSTGTPETAQSSVRGGGTSGTVLFRLLVILLSAAGVLTSVTLWATGHAVAALRVLAGDVLALVVLLLLPT